MVIASNEVQKPAVTLAAASMAPVAPGALAN
jgi:hypothetical protein